MTKLIEWHKKYTEKTRNKLSLSHYQTYWVSWFKGIFVGLLITFLVSCGDKSQSEWIYLFDGKSLNTNNKLFDAASIEALDIASETEKEM